MTLEKKTVSKLEICSLLVTPESSVGLVKAQIAGTTTRVSDSGGGPQEFAFLAHSQLLLVV